MKMLTIVFELIIILICIILIIQFNHKRLLIADLLHSIPMMMMMMMMILIKTVKIPVKTMTNLIGNIAI